ncbi:MAG: histidinol-phosphate transaminase [Deferribacteraceae bacterium]|jgi:histidinol-phosphate aminotransferase|nr:histidinol-phosphate transaminase [Deferribacteraceae bacterium]
MPADFRLLAGEQIARLEAYKPGKPIEELKREYSLKRVIKLASNENPYGTSPKAAEAIISNLPELSRYPLGDAYNLRMALSEKIGVSPANLLFGAGSNEIIELLLRTFTHGEDNILFPAPTFSVYAIIAQAMGAASAAVDTAPAFEFDTDALLKSVTPKTRILFLASPNNPPGTYMRERELRRLIAELPENVILAVDAAYAEFADAADYPDINHWHREYPNIVVLKTFSKAYGLAGLRIGYAIGDEVCIDMMNKVRQPFNTGSLSQCAACAALSDTEFLNKVISANLKNKHLLYKEFEKLGLSYIPSQANFILVRVGDGERVFLELLKKGVIVRYMGTSLKEYIRISIGTEEECEILLSSLKEVL